MWSGTIPSVSFSQAVDVDAFNASQRGEVYGEAPAITAERFAQHVERNAIDLTRSPRWTFNAILSGVALLGFRGRRAWVGGFGVVPEFRGRGLGRRYLEDVFAICRDAGAEPQSIAAAAPWECLIVGDDAAPQGYAFVRRYVDRATLLDAGARDAASAALLLDALDAALPEVALIILNEPAHGPLHEAFTGRTAWTETVRQYQTRRSLIGLA